jgi:hypothetical protein
VPGRRVVPSSIVIGVLTVADVAAPSIGPTTSAF